VDFKGIGALIWETIRVDFKAHALRAVSDACSVHSIYIEEFYSMHTVRAAVVRGEPHF
jgi:hypothetical protein